MEERPAQPLHRMIGNLINEAFGNDPDLIIVRGSACQEPGENSDQTIPLFLDLRKDNRTEFCNVDLVIMKHGRIRVIMEIEETETSPDQLYGKFMTTAMSRYYIRDTRGDFDMDESMTFIQIVGTSKKEIEKTRLLCHLKDIEHSIGGVLKDWRIPIRRYSMIAGEANDFEFGNKTHDVLIKTIKIAVAEKKPENLRTQYPFKCRQLNKEELWQLLHESISRKCQITRIENADALGVPDVNIGYHKYDFWLELKSEEKGYCPVTTKQLEWQYQRIKNHCQNSFYLISMELGNTCLYAAKDLIKHDLVVSSGDEVKLILTRERPVYCVHNHDWMQFILEPLHSHVFFSYR